MTKQGQNSNFTPTIGNTRGRPLLLDEELDLKLGMMIITLQTAGAGTSAHIVRVILNDLVHANPEKFGRYIHFQVN